MTCRDEAVAALRRTIDAGTERWFQQFEAVPGLWTGGESDMAALAARVALPADMTGLSVLDLGTNDGFMAFEAERRGAARVLAVDHPTAWGYGPFSAPGVDKRRRFELVHAARGSRAVAVPLDLEGPEDAALAALPGPHDLVLFLGVLYHLQAPLRAFGLLRRLVCPGGLLIVETHVDLADVDRPAAAFYPASPGKPAWWGPNPACVAGMLAGAGFTKLCALPPDAPGATRLAWHAR